MMDIHTYIQLPIPGPCTVHGPMPHANALGDKFNYIAPYTIDNILYPMCTLHLHLDLPGDDLKSDRQSCEHEQTAHGLQWAQSMGMDTVKDVNYDACGRHFRRIFNFIKMLHHGYQWLEEGYRQTC